MTPKSQVTEHTCIHCVLTTKIKNQIFFFFLGGGGGDFNMYICEAEPVPLLFFS